MSASGRRIEGPVILGKSLLDVYCSLCGEPFDFAQGSPRAQSRGEVAEWLKAAVC